MEATALRAHRLAITGVAAGALALALPATAAAGKVTHKLSGPVVGDPNGSVSIQVVVKNGKPRKVKNLAYQNLDAFCDPDGSLGPQAPEPAGELSGSGGQNQGPSLEADRSFNWFSYPDNGARQVIVRGQINKKGTKVTGEIDVFDNQACASSTKNKFTATK